MHWCGALALVSGWHWIGRRKEIGRPEGGAGPFDFARSPSFQMASGQFCSCWTQLASVHGRRERKRDGQRRTTTSCAKVDARAQVSSGRKFSQWPSGPHSHASTRQPPVQSAASWTLAIEPASWLRSERHKHTQQTGTGWMRARPRRRSIPACEWAAGKPPLPVRSRRFRRRGPQSDQGGRFQWQPMGRAVRA